MNTEYHIAVIGLACHFPGAKNYQEFWQNLLLGKETIHHFSMEELQTKGIEDKLLYHPQYVKTRGVIPDADYFDADFFGFSPNDAKLTDPQIRLFLECSRNALEDAGYYSEEKAGKIGVFAGQSHIHSYWEKYILPYPKLLKKWGDYYVHLSNSSDFLSTKVSYKLNLTGPSYTLQTACSTSLVAVCEAAQHLLNYQCDMALAGGVALQFPLLSGYLYQEGMILSKDGYCRAFDEKANGTVPGNGVGVVALKRYQDALDQNDHIYAVIKGFATNNDGNKKIGYSAPSIQGQAAVIEEALALADCQPESITYIETHGTGTSQGDPIEIEALKKVFFSMGSQKNCALGAVKTNIGHCDVASGIAGFIKTVLSLYYKKIPKTLHFNKLNPEISLENTPFFINDTLRDWENLEGLRRAGVSSFGIGGSNAHIILEEFPKTYSQINSIDKQYIILPLSAKNLTALEQTKKNLLTYVEETSEVNLLDIAYTYQLGRESFNHRCFLIAKDKTTLVNSLKTPLNAVSKSHLTDQSSPKIAFLFPGQGTAIENLVNIYQEELIFRQHIDELSKMIKDQWQLDLKTYLFSETNLKKPSLSSIEILMQQLCLFSIEYALAKLWIHWGIYPDFMIGHSLGEYVAAGISNVFSTAEIIEILYLRHQFLEKCPQGEMLVVRLNETKLKSYLSNGLSISAINAENLYTISGSSSKINQLSQNLIQDKIACKKISVTKPFHSSLLNTVHKPFTDSILHIEAKAPVIPYFSNVTGELIEKSSYFYPEYWADHLCKTVYFYDAIKKLENENTLFLEVGIGNSLLEFVKKTIPKSDFISTFPTPYLSSNAYSSLLTALGQFWLKGIAVNWENFNDSHRGQRIPLPTYPYQKQKYCIDTSNENFLQSFDRGSILYEPYWRREDRKNISVTLQEKLIIIIFHNRLSSCKLIKAQLEQMNHKILNVYYGKEFFEQDEQNYTVDPYNAMSCEKLMASIQKNYTINGIIFCAGLSNETTFCKNLPEYFLYAFYILQALHKFSPQIKIFFTIIAQSIWRISEKDALHDPFKATLVGISKTLPYDFRNVCTKIIDIPNLDIECISSIAQEAICMHRENVAYRDTQRWFLAYKQVLFQDEIKPDSLIKKNRAYLITGGLGGIGLNIAKAFSDIKSVHLILLQRSFFPKKSKWKEWIKSHEPSDHISSKIQILRNIESNGSEIHILQADISDKKSMQKALIRLENNFSSIEGIIHAAGLAEGTLISMQSEENLGKIFSPKVQGVLQLYEFFKNKKIDFILLCSALTAITGNIGQLGYCSANNFLDSFAKWCSHQNIRMLSINWDTWKDIGMASHLPELFNKLKFKSFEEQNIGLSKNENISLLWTCLSQQTQQLIVSNELLEERVEKNKQLAAHLHSEDLYNSDFLKSSSISSDATSSIKEKVLKNFITYLGIKDIHQDSDFFSLGGDSLLAIQFTSALEKEIDIKLYPHHIQKFPTPRLLSNYILEQTSSTQLKNPNEKLPFSIVNLQKGNKTEFLFLIHPVGGTFYIYRDLISHLSKEITIYGIQAQNLDETDEPIESIEEIAFQYIKLIKLVNSKGPYNIGGFSFGGIVAYEMAQQLSKAKELVDKVIMLDSPHYKNPPQPFKDHSDIISYLLSLTVGYHIHPNDLRKLSKHDQIHLFLERSGKFSQALADNDIIIVERFLNIFQSNAATMAKYLPKPYCGASKILFFKATEPDAINPTHPEQGWKVLLKNKVKVYNASGNHITMMFNPNVSQVTFILNKLFENLSILI